MTWTVPVFNPPQTLVESRCSAVWNRPKDLSCGQNALTLVRFGSTVREDNVSDSFDNSGHGVPPPPPGIPPSGNLPSPSPFLPPTQPVYSNPVHTPAYSDTNIAELTEGPTSAPKRSRGKMFGALAGVVVLLGAATFAVTRINSDKSSSGGASSPKDVGDKLVTSLGGEDLLGVVDLLLPGERETFRQPLVDLNTQLQRLEVTSGSVNLNKVPGLAINITGPVVKVHDTNVSDISNIEVTGNASVAVNGKDVPIGKLLIETVFNGKRPDVHTNANPKHFDVTMTTVEQSGRWYLSMLYTAATQLGKGQDIPAKGVTAVGADTPDGALDNVITAAGKLDLASVIAGLNPNEAGALQRFAPLFLDKAQSNIDSSKVDVKIRKAKYKVTGSGDRRQVAITAITVRAKRGSQVVEFELNKGCITGTSGTTTFDTCSAKTTGDGAIGGYLDSLKLPNSAELTKFVDDARKAFSDFEMHGIVVDKVNGKWFVSPIGTGSEFVLSVLRALTRDEVNTLVNDGKAAVTGLLSSIFGQIGINTNVPTDNSTVTTSGSTSDTTSGSASGSTAETTTSDTTTSDRTTSGTTFDTSPVSVNPDESSFWYDCLSVTPISAASACIQKGIKEGRFDVKEIPGPYQYPDCGLLDYYNGSKIFSDTPAEFDKTIAPARKCILDAAAKAGTDISYNTPEIAHPECYVGVNPFNYTDSDADAISAAYDCATAAG